MSIGSRVAGVVSVALFCALPAHAADATGKWKAEFDTQVGLQKYTFDLKVEGGKLTGKASFERMGEKGEVDLQEGRVEGDGVSFVETLSFPGQQGPHHHLHGQGGERRDPVHRKVGDFATEEFVAKRVKVGGAERVEVWRG